MVQSTSSSYILLFGGEGLVDDHIYVLVFIVYHYGGVLEDSSFPDVFSIRLPWVLMLHISVDLGSNPSTLSF